MPPRPDDSPTAAPRLAVRDLAMRFGARRLFAGVTFEVGPREPLVITGPNGSGKSTLLRILAGVTEPVAGEVALHVGGREVPGAARPQTVGLVAPALELYDPFTGRENLEFVASARRLEGAAGRIETVLERVGLAGRGDERLATYSTGMRQRMRIASALLHAPPVLLLDEPGATLDAAGRALVETLVRTPETVVVLATNDPEEARLGARRLDLG